MDNLYFYNAALIRIIDGDTLELLIDAGFNLWFRTKVRLININCPEMDTPEGKAAKQFMESVILNKKLHVKTYKADSFGRYLVDLYCEDVHINQLLIDKGHAK